MERHPRHKALAIHTHMFTEITGHVLHFVTSGTKGQEILTTNSRAASRQACYKLQRKQFVLDVDGLGLFKICQVAKLRQVSVKAPINF